MKFGSLFSGIGGFDLGLERAGMECAFQVEREPSCISVLGKHWPNVPCFNDVREFNAANIAIRPDLICGGFPCQDLSVAGRRAGLAGERSGLFFDFMRIVAEFAPRWVLIENVPGLLSSNGGRDMGTVLGTLGKLGYGWAYRVLDAQWFGVPQRRRRVFIVGCAGDFRRAAEVLFERESLPWDSPPSRETGKGVARCLTRGSDSGSRFDGDTENFIAGTLNSGGNDGGFRTEPGEHLVARPLKAGGNLRHDESHDTYIVHTLRAEGFDASEDGTGRGTPLIPIDMRQASRGELMTNNRREGSTGGAPGTGIGEDGDPSPTLADSHTPAIAFTQRTRDGHANVECSDISYCLDAPVDGGRKKGGVVSGMAVRRLTPRECERLQGFPDDWTRYGADGKEISDSARYRMCGNAVAVPVAEWIAQRITEAT